MEDNRKIQFLQNELLRKVFDRNSDLKDFEVVKCSLGIPMNLDGFMGIMYKLDVTASNRCTGDTIDLNLFVKVMKPGENFRRESLGFILFPNEINAYKNIIPAFKQLIMNRKSSIDTDAWCPRIYFSEYEKFPEYSDQLESILVMHNAQTFGYTAGPPLDLDMPHLALMARKIAQFHACSYALRILNNNELKRLVEQIIPLNYIENGEVVFKSYNKVFRYTLERIYSYFDENPQLLTDTNIRIDLELLRKQYVNDPSSLMQRCIEKDDIYSIILHGDYNRNNVLFKYQNGVPKEMIMIDFQENRYGSPAIDLSFFMYLNINGESRDVYWNQVLKCYHDELIRCICEITKLPIDDIRLEPYRFSNFEAHLKNYFIYGAIIAVKFLPVLMSPPADVAKIVHYFENDIYSEGFGKILKNCGGPDINQRLAGLLLHCSRMGYMKFLREK